MVDIAMYSEIQKRRRDGYSQRATARESTDNLVKVHGIPITHEAFDEKLVLTINEEIKLKETGTKQTVWAGSTVEIEYEPEVDAEELRELISKEYSAIIADIGILEIIYEESTKMFTGEETAQTTAKNIQKRAVEVITDEQD